MPRKEWVEDLCHSVKTQAACGFIIAHGGCVNLDPDNVVARLERIPGGVDVLDVLSVAILFVVVLSIATCGNLN